MWFTEALVLLTFHSVKSKFQQQNDEQLDKPTSFQLTLHSRHRSTGLFIPSLAAVMPSSWNQISSVHMLICFLIQSVPNRLI